jgi:REP element-mobilizing transposase RayT
VLKQKVSAALHKRRRRTLLGQLPLEFACEQADEGHFWQRRFYDFNVWSAKKVKEKLEYIHANPVQRKLVVHPKDWPWSSFSFYAYDKQGLIRIDAVD